MKNYPTYDEMKDSDVECLGEIPEHWFISKIKYIKSKEKNSFVDGPFGSDLKSKHYKENGEVLVITSEFATRGKLNINSLKKISKEHFEKIKRSEVKENDIVIAKIGEYFGLSNILPKLDYPSVISGNSMKLTVDKENNIRFIHYQLLFLKKIGCIDLLPNTTAQPALSLGKMNQLVILKPPLQEQIKIVDFLDKETNNIDQLIERKEQLIDLLEEKRQALISQAVTKGLNPDVKMKDSGIDWIGETPDNWEIMKIKYTTYVKGRVGWHGLTSDEFIDEGPYLVTGTDFFDGRIDWDSCYHISNERYEEDPYIQLREGDLLITKDGTIGKTAIVKDMPDKAILNSGIFVTRPISKQYITKFMYWVLNSKIFEEYISLTTFGSTIKHLYQKTFEDFYFPVPSLEEQEEIVNYLNERTTKIDNLIEKIEKQITNLKEYRQTLISNAVTGEIDVRDLA